MKKILTLITTFCLTIGVLAGCSGSSTLAPTAETSLEKKELTLWHFYSSPATQEALTKQIEAYNNLATAKAVIKEQFIPRDELIKKYTLGVSTGDLPDLAIIDNPDSAAHAAMGMFADLTDRFNAWDDNKFMEGPLNTGKYDGKVYTIPVRSNSLGLWVNRDKLDAAGIDKIPETWEEFMAACEQLKADDPAVYPFAFAAIKNEEAVFQFIPFLYSAGGSVDTMDSAESINALGNLKQLAENGYVSAEVINWSQGDVEKQFAAGNAAMMYNGSWNIPNLATDAPDLNYEVSYLPKVKEFASCMGGENIGITVTCQEQDAAWDFIEYLCGTEASVALNTSIGTIAPHSEVSAKEQYPDDPAMQVFVKQLEVAIARGPSPKWGEISSVIQEAIQSVMIGAKTPELAGQEAATKISTINSSL